MDTTATAATHSARVYAADALAGVGQAALQVARESAPEVQEFLKPGIQQVEASIRKWSGPTDGTSTQR